MWYVVHMELPNALKNLGFTDKEAAIYLALLEFGQATGYQVAKKSGLKQPTAYVILDGLIERGAAKKVLGQKHNLFEATDPVEIFVEARERVEQAAKELPTLRAMAQNKGKVVQTSYYEGLAGIKEMYKNLLREAEGTEYVGFFASDKDSPKELTAYWPELNKQMEEKKIKIRGITTKDETTKPYLSYSVLPKELLDIKGLPPSIYSSNISIEMYGEFTQITSHRYMQAVLIQNADVANVLRQIFEIAWKAKGE